MDTKLLLRHIGLALMASAVLFLFCAIYNEARVESVLHDEAGNPVVTGHSVSVLLYVLAAVTCVNSCVLLHASSNWGKPLRRPVFTKPSS